MTYKFTVPPTHDVGSYSSTCKAGYLETYRQDALRDYNHARAHDGLPPLSRMPRGTEYRALYEYEIQRLYDGAWETENTEIRLKDAVQSIKEYRENAPGCYRIKKVRI